MLVELQTLGHCVVAIGDERLGPQSPFAFALALYLGVERGRPHTREQLLPLFFPGAPEANAAHNLRQTLYKLRQLGFPAETTSAGTVLAATDVRDDYTRLLATGALPDPDASRLPGEFLPGYWPRLSDEYTRWLEGQRDAINSALRRAYVSRILDRRAVARWDEVERYARACLAIDPLNEEATLALAEALALSGSKAAGVKVLERFMEEVGGDSRLSLPASVLRKRIAERVRPRPASSYQSRALGRDEELRTLGTLAADAQTALPRVALIWGEAGIGKTHLVRNFSATFRLTGVRIIEVQCEPHDLRRPMSVVVDLAPQLSRSPGAMGADPNSLHILNRLHTVDTDATPSHLVAAGASADQTTAVITDALSDMLDAIASEGTTFIIVEDLHWADTASRKVVGHLISESKQRSILWIVTSRDTLASFVSAGTPAHLPLTGLRESDARDLITSLMSRERDGDSDAPLRERILTLAGGNPFYIQALCTYYDAHGSAEGTPPVLRSLITQRLAALAPAERTVLAACAVLGRHASTHRVSALVELPVHELANTVASLEQSQLIDPQGGRLTVQHALIASTLFEHESAGRLAVIRRSAAQLLESEAAGSGEIALVWEAADLWTLCGEAERAKKALMSSAIHAAQLGAAKEAIDAMERFAAVASQSEAANLGDRIRAVVHRESTTDFRLLDRWQRGIELSTESRYAAALELLAMEVSRRYRSDGEARLERLIAMIEDTSVELALRIRAGSMAMCTADDTDDAAMAERIVAALDFFHRDIDEADPDAVRLALVYNTVFGERQDAITLANRVLSRPAPQTEPGDLARSILNAGVCLAQCGQMRAARAALERGFDTCVRSNYVGPAGVAAAHSLWAARQVGDKAGAEKWAAELHRIAAAYGIQTIDTTGLYNLATFSLDTLDADAAVHYMDELKSRVTFYSRSSHWTMFTGLRLRTEWVTGESSVSAEDLEIAADWSTRTAPRNPEDDVALSIYLGMTRTRYEAAVEYLRAYLRDRQPRFPVLPQLQNVADAKR